MAKAGQELPAPLTPPDCDIRTMPYMPVMGQRVRDSLFYAQANDAEFRAGFNLWWSAWTQVPAGSLPDDDVALCRLADLGRDLDTWKRLRKHALHGFVLCSDGRLYHPLLCEHALKAWTARKAERERKANWRTGKVKGERVPRTETGTTTGQDADVPALREAKLPLGDKPLREGSLRSPHRNAVTPRRDRVTEGLDVPPSHRHRTEGRQTKTKQPLGKVGGNASATGKVVAHPVQEAYRPINLGRFADAVEKQRLRQRLKERFPQYFEAINARPGWPPQLIVSAEVAQEMLAIIEDERRLIDTRLASERAQRPAQDRAAR